MHDSPVDKLGIRIYRNIAISMLFGNEGRTRGAERTVMEGIGGGTRQNVVRASFVPLGDGVILGIRGVSLVCWWILGDWGLGHHPASTRSPHIETHQERPGLPVPQLDVSTCSKPNLGAESSIPRYTHRRFGYFRDRASWW
jgi:hypothetical protein